MITLQQNSSGRCRSVRPRRFIVDKVTAGVGSSRRYSNIF